jgi:hypothetical protein
MPKGRVTKCRFFCDDTYGWLRVKKEDAIELGICDKISIYSMEEGYYIYLEEYADAELFTTACLTRGWEVRIKYHKYEEYSVVRDMEPYRAGT